MEKSKRVPFFSSNTSIVGLFSTLVFMLTIPLIVLLAGQPQDIRQRAAEPTQPIVVTQPVQQLQGNGTISGYVYYDVNKNGQRDKDEKPFPGATLIITHIKQDKTNVVTTYKTDDNGFFSAHFTNLFPDVSTYVVKLSLPNGYKTVNTNPILIPNQQKDMQQEVTFGLFPFSKITPLPTQRAKPVLPTKLPFSTPTPAL